MTGKKYKLSSAESDLASSTHAYIRDTRLRTTQKLILTIRRARSLSHTHTPGNYVTVNGRDPFMKAGGKLEDQLWSEINDNAAGAQVASADGPVEEGGEGAALTDHSYLNSPTKV